MNPRAFALSALSKRMSEKGMGTLRGKISRLSVKEKESPAEDAGEAKEEGKIPDALKRLIRQKMEG